MIALALLVLVAANAARAQSTASLFPVGFMDDGLRGEAVGTGADGTTYVLSATFDELDVPYTMTLVEDATHVSITAALETAGVTVPVDVQCAMGGGDAVCRQVIGTGIDATTFTESGAVALTAVPIGAGSGGSVSGSASGTSRISFSSSAVATGTFGGPPDGTALPPSLSLGGTATLATSGSSNTGLTVPGLTSGALNLKDGIFALGCFAIPAVLAALHTI